MAEPPHQLLKFKVPADDSGSWTKILYCPHYDTNLKIRDPKMALLGGWHYTQSSEKEIITHAKRVSSLAMI